MKAHTVIALLFFSVPSMADGPTAIHGYNDAGEELYIYVDGEVPTDPPAGFDPVKYPKITGFTKSVYKVEVVKHGERRFETKERYRKQDCWINARVAYQPGFSCSAQSHSPLAGTEYVFAKHLPMCRGTLLACKSGCGLRAPLELIIDPWECGEEIVADCPNSDAKKGFISGDDVNVREKPEPSGSILRTISYWTRVDILKRDPRCLELNKKRGRWVFVNIHDNGDIRQGWIFDAYIVEQYLSLTVPRPTVSTGWEGSEHQRLFRTGDITGVKRIVATYPKQYLELNETAFSEAVGAGRVELIRYLSTLGWLKQCANSQFCDPPLRTTALNDDLEMMRYLMSEGFKPSADVILEVAQAGGRDYRAIELLIRNSTGGGALALSRTKDFKIVKLLCEAGADPDVMLPLDGRNTTAAKELAWEVSHVSMYEDQRAPLRKILEYFESGQCKQAAARKVR